MHSIRGPVAVYSSLAIGFFFASTLLAEDSNARLELRSYLGACKANWDSVRTFDVLIRTDTYRDSPYASDFVSTTYERMIFDFDEMRFLYITRGTKQFVEAGKKQLRSRGFVMKEGHVRSFESPAEAIDVTRVENREKLFDKFHVPDIRLSMFLKLGRTGGAVWADKSYSAFQTFPVEAEVVGRSVTEGGDDSSVTFSMRFPNQVTYSWAFGSDSLAPQNASWGIVRSDGAKLVVGKERYEWEDRRGISVPRLISGSFTEPEVPAGIKRTSKNIKQLLSEAVIQRDVQMAWISVNEKIPSERFDFRQLDSVSSFLALSDPISQGVPLPPPSGAPGAP